VSNYRGHIGFSFGLALGIFVIFFLLYTMFSINILAFPLKSTLGQFFLLTVVISFGIWPDIDTNSVAQDIFYSLFFLADVALIFLEYYKISAIFGLIALLPIVAKHRGWTHSRLSAILTPALIFIVPSMVNRELALNYLPFAFAGVLGYLGHLLLDGKLFSK
jgi:membrane-bound metal-dependent hydrolase YbcI (DUF457 family)